MTNYIEITHEYKDEKYGDDNRDVYFAVKPTPSSWCHREETEWYMGYDEGWAVNGGQPVRVQDRNDVAGLRKLLDAIEEEMSK